MTDRLVARARVLAAQDDGRVSLQLAAEQACPGCRCGRLAAPAPRTVDLVLAAPVRLRAGAEVSVSVPVGDVLRSAAWLHGMPWAALVLGAGAAAVAGCGDLGVLVGGALGLIGAIVYLRRAPHAQRASSAPDVRIAAEP